MAFKKVENVKRACSFIRQVRVTRVRGYRVVIGLMHELVPLPAGGAERFWGDGIYGDMGERSLHQVLTQFSYFLIYIFI